MEVGRVGRPAHNASGDGCYTCPWRELIQPVTLCGLDMIDVVKVTPVPVGR